MPPAALPADITLRRATVADADALSTLAMRTFVGTFGYLYPRHDLERFVADTYSPESQRALLAAPDHALWLLDQGETLIGYALAGPCALPHPEARADDGELKRLYLIKPVQSLGLGTHLMRTALDWLLKDGARTLWLGVWSQNLGAQRFYARYGFSKAGEYLYPVGESRDREFIFRRPPQAQNLHPL